jgi:ankyrin repeat protein
MHEPNTLNTALHIACKHNHMNIARFCLDNGAHVDSLNKDGNTPLFCAAERFSSSCAKVKNKNRIFWVKEIIFLFN